MRPQFKCPGCGGYCGTVESLDIHRALFCRGDGRYNSYLAAAEVAGESLPPSDEAIRNEQEADLRGAEYDRIGAEYLEALFALEIAPGIVYPEAEGWTVEA